MQGYQGITNEILLISIVNQVSKGLMRMHEKGIIHRDLKVENVILGKDFQWKIIDLGSSTKVAINSELDLVDKDAFFDEIEMVTTPNYRAPEQID